MTNSPRPDSSILLETTLFAANKHSTQRRKNVSKTPYIEHPITVAHLIAESFYPETAPVYILQGALLHDTVEDTDCSYEELEAAFGDVVSRIVRECSDDKDQPSEVRKLAQIEHAPTISQDAKHVKLADKLANLSDLLSEKGTPAGWKPIRIQEYFIWAKKVTDGCKEVNPFLADRLEQLYKSATFEHSGKTYKAHPHYS